MVATVSSSSSVCVVLALAVVVATLLAFSKSVYIRLRALYYLGAIPGPPMESLFLGSFKLSYLPKIHRWYKRWAIEFGGVYSMRVANNAFVIVTDPLLMPELFKLPRAHVYAAATRITI